MARLSSVNVMHVAVPGRWMPSGIDKRPVVGPVAVGITGVDGDRQLNEQAHGGRDRAVYAYASEDSVWWGDRLGRVIPPGLWGENLTTRGLDVSGAVIGERWRVGGEAGVLLEVRMPRTPCENLSAWIGIERFHRDFAASGRVGAMLAVLEPGPVSRGDPVVVVHRPAHRVTIADLATSSGVDRMPEMLAADVKLAAPVRAKARRLLTRHGGGDAR